METVFPVCLCERTEVIVRFLITEIVIVMPGGLTDKHTTGQNVTIMEIATAFPEHSSKEMVLRLIFMIMGMGTVLPFIHSNREAICSVFMIMEIVTAIQNGLPEWKMAALLFTIMEIAMVIRRDLSEEQATSGMFMKPSFSFLCLV